MGRPENPVTWVTAELTQLAELLRNFRSRSGLTYDAMAQRTGLSAATLKRAAAGRKVPALATVKAFTVACMEAEHDKNAIPLHEQARALAVEAAWQHARAAERGRLRGMRPLVHPTLATRRGEISSACVYFYEEAGAPPLRKLQAAAGGAHLLPVSTAARIVRRETMPASRQQFEAFMVGCAVPGHRRRAWLQAWDNVTDPDRVREDARKRDQTARLDAIERRLIQTKVRNSGMVVDLTDHGWPGFRVNVSDAIAAATVGASSVPADQATWLRQVREASKRAVAA